MKKIKLYITASSDGYIAPPDGSLEWLVNYPIPSKEDHKNFLESVDTVLIGGNTYHEMYCMDILWPYKEKEVHVVSSYPIAQKDDVNFITEDVVETISKLKEENGKDIWLVGDTEVITLLSDNKLLDEIIVTYVSEKLESGIPLFSTEMKEEWILEEEITYENKAVKKTYLRA